MNKLGLKSKLNYNDYDKIIAAVLTEMTQSDKPIFTDIADIGQPQYVFAINVIGIYHLFSTEPVIITGKWRTFRKIKKLFKITNIKYKRRVNYNNYNSFIDIFHNVCKKMYPNEIPFVVAQEIGEEYYCIKNNGDENGNTNLD